MGGRPDVPSLNGRWAVKVRWTVGAPSGADRHDYVSLSIYWWPNPDTASGLPYVLHDGRRNPEADDETQYDERRLARVVRGVDTLALAYYLTGSETYAEQAVGF